MSTCPDLDLYSAYADGEIPSPWKEKLENHLSACPKCRARVEQYKKLKTLIRSNVRDLSAAEFEASFARVSMKRAALNSGKQSHKERIMPEWVHVSVRLPLPALAAVILAAVFLPTVVIIANASRMQSQGMQYASKFPALQAPSGLNTSLRTNKRPVYSSDLPEQSIPVELNGNSTNVFTMIQYARQFATDKDPFAPNGEIIIIRLPELTRFSNTGDQQFTTGATLQKNAGFYK